MHRRPFEGRHVVLQVVMLLQIYYPFHAFQTWSGAVQIER